MILISLLFASPYILPAYTTTGETNFKLFMSELRPGGPVTRFLNDAFVSPTEKEISWSEATVQLLKFFPSDVLPKFPFLQAHFASIFTQNVPDSIFKVRTVPRFEIIRPWFFNFFILVLILAVSGLLLSGIKKNIPTFCFGLVGFLMLAMMVRISSPLWKILPGLYALQFPWRWLFPGIIFLLPCVSDFLDHLWNSGKKSFVILLIGPYLLFGALFQSFSQAPAQETFDGYMENRSIIAIEFTPVTVPDPFELNRGVGIMHYVMSTSQTEKLENVNRGFEWANFNSNFASPGAEIVINTHMDPYWRLTDGKKEIELKLNEKNGTMKAWIDSGEKKLSLYRIPPAFRNLGWVFMVFSIIIGMLWIYSEKIFRRQSEGKNNAL
ncbi:MAG: hypothetical protein WA705_28240 [Candidatus Ozemobacteraceae bacterium]